MSELHPGHKDDLKLLAEQPQTLIQLHEQLVNAKSKYLFLMSNYEELLIQYEKLMSQLATLSEKLHTEIRQCDQLLKHWRDAQRQKVKLIRYQQYRDETEWKCRLKEEYEHQVKKGRYFVEQLHQKTEDYWKVRRQLENLEPQKEQQTEQLRQSQQQMQQQKKVVQDLKQKLEQQNLELQ